MNIPGILKNAPAKLVIFSASCRGSPTYLHLQLSRGSIDVDTVIYKIFLRRPRGVSQGSVEAFLDQVPFQAVLHRCRALQ